MEKNKAWYNQTRLKLRSNNTHHIIHIDSYTRRNETPAVYTSLTAVEVMWGYLLSTYIALQKTELHSFPRKLKKWSAIQTQGPVNALSMSGFNILDHDKPMCSIQSNLLIELTAALPTSAIGIRGSRSSGYSSCTRALLRLSNSIQSTINSFLCASVLGLLPPFSLQWPSGWRSCDLPTGDNCPLAFLDDDGQAIFCQSPVAAAFRLTTKRPSDDVGLVAFQLTVKRPSDLKVPHARTWLSFLTHLLICSTNFVNVFFMSKLLLPGFLPLLLVFFCAV